MNRLVRVGPSRPPGPAARFLSACAVLAALGSTAALGGLGATATASAAGPGSAVSTNWAGYAVAHRSIGSSSVKFKRVTGTWIQPAPTCNSAGATYAAFWVGLGGFHSRLGLEQIGTEADCNTAGGVSHNGWYELIPAAPRRLRLTIRPGDTVSASVAVRGRRATLSLIDQTTGGSFVKRVRIASPDMSSAEWIVEAPSACDHLGSCTTLPLANFGTVTFSAASATANGHTGSISDALWTATPIELHFQTHELGRPQFTSPVTPANAVPAALTPPGSAFSVSWQEQKTPAPTQPATPFPGAGQP
jgi:hypothetical protein